MVLEEVRAINSSISEIVAQQKQNRIRIHYTSLIRYMGGEDEGLRRLRKELEAENSGVHIPAEIRWLGGSKVRARFQEVKDGPSLVMAAVLGEVTFCRLCKSGVHLLGSRYEVDAFEEARPDAFCSRCSAWGHIAPHCKATDPRCTLCSGAHATFERRRRPVEGCRVRGGHPCPHGEARCANCGGPHGARVDACAAKKKARQFARGLRSPQGARRESPRGSRRRGPSCPGGDRRRSGGQDGIRDC